MEIMMPFGTSYLEAKQYAGERMAQDPRISSVRVKVNKYTHQIIIECQLFPQNTVDKLTNLCYNTYRK